MFTKKGHVDLKKSTAKFLDSKRESPKRLKDLRTVLGQFAVTVLQSVPCSPSDGRPTHCPPRDSCHSLLPLVFVSIIRVTDSQFCLSQKTRSHMRRGNCSNTTTVTFTSSSSTHYAVLRAASKSKVSPDDLLSYLNHLFHTLFQSISIRHPFRVTMIAAPKQAKEELDSVLLIFEVCVPEWDVA